MKLLMNEMFVPDNNNYTVSNWRGGGGRWGRGGEREVGRGEHRQTDRQTDRQTEDNGF